MNVKRGRTSAHYLASQAARRAVFERRSPQEVLDIVRSNVVLVGDCWVWLGAGAGGVGTISIDGYHWTVTRLVTEATGGPIPPGFLACHTCDIMQCVNPAHLYAGTAAQNGRDRRERWRGTEAYTERVRQAQRVRDTLVLTKGRT